MCACARSMRARATCRRSSSSVRSEHMGSWPPTLRATAAVVLAAGHAAAQASYGNMGQGQDPPWFLFLAAAVLALPGGLFIFILEASLGWRKLPRGTGLVFAVAMAAFVYNAFFPGLVAA